ncbi:hypothetical protein HY994_01500 [Candidatus Micrarchaeota archaeon]|nr:hypothetical protein [Candidatus Micrarchaeota archaeon]
MRQEIHHVVVTHPPNQPILRELLDQNQQMPDENTHKWWKGERKELEGEMLHTTLALRTHSADSSQPDLAVKIIDGIWPHSMVAGPARILAHLYEHKVPCVKLLGYIIKERETQPSKKKKPTDEVQKLDYPERGEFFVKWEKNAVPLNHSSVRPAYKSPHKRADIIKQLANLFAFFHGRHNPYATEAKNSHLPNDDGDILINDCKLENFLFIRNRSGPGGTVKVLDPELWELKKRSPNNEEDKDHDIETLLNSAYKDGLVTGKPDVEEFVRQYLGLHHKKISGNGDVQAKAWKLTERAMKYLEAETPI